MSFTEEITAQYIRFDELRDEIHNDLVAAGVGDVIEAHGIHLATEPFVPRIPQYLQDFMDEHPDISPLPGNLQYHLDKAWRHYKGRTQVSRYIVARARGYSSQKADIDIDLDPLAQVISMGNEVGVMTQVYEDGNPLPQSSALHVTLVSESWIGNDQESTEVGDKFNFSQLALIESSLKKLVHEKFHGEPRLRYLTKSLTKIDPAGD